MGCHCLLRLTIWVLAFLPWAGYGETVGGDTVRDMGPDVGREDPLEEEMATHSSILAWEIPRTEEPGGLQSMGSQRVGYN